MGFKSWYQLSFLQNGLFYSPHFALEETLKPLVLSMWGEVTDPTQGVNVYRVMGH